MESIGRLAGGVAHDFNNLLAPILGYADLLLLEERLDPAVRGDLEQIHKAAEHARDLTRQLLAFGRKQLLSMTTHDLREVVSEFEPLLRRTIREEISLVVDEPQRPHGILDKGIEFIQKPFSVEILASRLRDVLGS